MRRRALVIVLAFVSAACVTKDEKKKADGAAPDAAIAIADSARPPSTIVARRAPAILVLGDSHTYGEFGHRLHERLASLGTHAVVSEAAGGATTETYLEEKPEAQVGYRFRESERGEATPRVTAQFLRGPMAPLGTLLAKYDPEIVVVALGTNRPRGDAAERCEAFLRRIVADRARRVFWVGPPAVGADRSATRSAGVKAALAKVPSATFIDSTTFNATALPADNPHFGPDDARRWADVAFAQMALVDAGSPPVPAQRDGSPRPKPIE